MFSKIKDESFDTGSQWGMDTFAWTVEMLMLKGMNLEEAYKLVKDTYTNKDSLNSRLDAWKELNV